jgi:UDP-N-acetylmuramoyl-tripeptide--D-alanyl-D-alanine ligase
MQIQELYSKYLQSSSITTDTRKIEVGSMFFALKGERFNANEFAEKAVLAGAAFVVVDELTNPAWRDLYKEKIIQVEDVLATMQQLAGYHRLQFKFPVLAITGSNGKTTTKELVAAVLAKKFKTAFTFGNLNNHIGIPVTLLGIDKEQTEFAVIEMGANHQGEIASYCEYVQPDFGLITNVGLAHIEGFGGFEGVIKGKTELYHNISSTSQGKIFLNKDNQILCEKANAMGLSAAQIITYGQDTSAVYYGNILPTEEFLTIQVNGQVIQSNLVGDYNFENAMSAIAIGQYFNVPMADIKSAIENYFPSNNRSQKIIRGTTTIILDAYNANPSSMAEALKNFSKLAAPKKMVILGEMMELGQYAEEEHKKIKIITESMSLAKCVFVGNGFLFTAADSNNLWFENAATTKTWLNQQDLTDFFILIKGSRKNELEKVL